MLLTLHILDLAVVERLELDFHSGMSVLTGETGAGKSILLTALGLALGDRADAGYVRPDKKRAEVSLFLGLHDAPAAKAWLQDNALDDDEQCILRRVVNEDGRSKAYINNRPVNLQALQALGRLCVEIHGQHAHLKLINSDEQRRLLDQFGQNDALLGEVNQCYRAWQHAQQQRQHLQKNTHAQTERQALLRYQLQELEQLQLANFDYDGLVERHQLLANIDQILSIGQQQLMLLDEHEAYAITRLLAQAVGALDNLTSYAENLQAVVQLLNDAHIQVGEAVQELRRFLDRQEADPQQLAVLDSQLNVIQSLARKHKIAPEQLPQLAIQLAQELDDFSHHDEQLEQLAAECERLGEQYQQLATQLSQRRHEQAKQLQTRITGMMRELGLAHGQFVVDMSTDATAMPKLHGYDAIEFLVSTNPGLPARPLAKVASGGELSRLSLAIQVVTSSDKTTPTMIFDEVDSGIGGAIAEVVGQKLRQLSHNRQVLCVTHLPQVAAQAHQHLFVAKQQHTAVTTSSVSLLAPAQRVTELARMLGGIQITENTLAHAQEMLDNAKMAEAACGSKKRQ